jgi:NAD(P)H-flavin reductase
LKRDNPRAFYEETWKVKSYNVKVEEEQVFISLKEGSEDVKWAKNKSLAKSQANRKRADAAVAKGEEDSSNSKKKSIAEKKIAKQEKKAAKVKFNCPVAKIEWLSDNSCLIFVDIPENHQSEWSASMAQLVSNPESLSKLKSDHADLAHDCLSLWHVDVSVPENLELKREFTPIHATDQSFVIFVKVYANGQLSPLLGKAENLVVSLPKRDESQLLKNPALHEAEKPESKMDGLRRSVAGLALKAGLGVKAAMHIVPNRRQLIRRVSTVDESPDTVESAVDAALANGKVVLLIAGGTGIAPMIQLRSVWQKGLYLLYYNRSEVEALDFVAHDSFNFSRKQFSLCFTGQLEKELPKKYAKRALSGRVSADHLLPMLRAKQIGAVVVCGPSGLAQAAAVAYSKALSQLEPKEDIQQEWPLFFEMDG